MNNLYATLIVIGYFTIAGVLGIIINTKTKLPSEIKRKLLHTFAFMSYLLFMYLFNSWIYAVIVGLIIGVGSFILIMLLEMYKPSFLTFFQERQEGEMKYTILEVFIVFGITITISWGCLNTTRLGLIAVMGWGCGDLFASLIGTRFGKYRFTKIPTLEKKSIEGSIACLIAVAGVTAIILSTFSYPVLTIVLFSLGAGLVGSLLELISRDGFDTLIMPIGLLLFSLILYIV